MGRFSGRRCDGRVPRKVVRWDRSLARWSDQRRPWAVVWSGEAPWEEGGMVRFPKRIVGRVGKVPGHIVSIQAEKWSRQTCSHQEQLSTGASSGKKALLTLCFYPADMISVFWRHEP